MNIVWKWLHIDEFDLYDVLKVWGEANVIKMQQNWMDKAEVCWPLTNSKWKNYKIQIDIFTFQPSYDEIEVNKDEFE